MTITETRPDEVAAPSAPASPAAPSAPAKVAGWLVSADHTRVGRLYVGVSLVAAVAVLVVGTLVMAERIDTGGTYLPSDSIAQLTSFTWIGLAFLVVVPLLLGIAIAVVPLQLGAAGIAYPRAAALSFWGWVLSGGVMVGAYLANGGPGGGEAQAVDLFLISLILVLASLAVGAACVAGSVITQRPAGMGLLETPPFSFASLVSAGALLLTLPVLAGTLVLLYVDHRYGRHRLRREPGHRRRDRVGLPATADLRLRHPDPRAHGRALPGGRWPSPTDAADGHRCHRAGRCCRRGRRHAGHAHPGPGRRDADPGPRPARRLRRHRAVAGAPVPDGPGPRRPGPEGRSAPRLDGSRRGVRVRRSRPR